MASTERIILFVLSATAVVFVVTSIITSTLLAVRTDNDDSTTSTMLYKEPDRIVSVFEYRDWAKANMEENAWFYFEDGATEQTTLEDNVQAYEKYKLKPKYLVDVKDFDSSVEVFGETIDTPVGIAPFAFQKWANVAGEWATARAAEKYGTVYILSSSASTTIEDVTRAAPNATKWMQIYPWSKRDEILYFIRRSEQAGFKGIVVTVDRPVGSIRYSGQKGLTDPPEYAKDVNFSNSSWEYQLQLGNPSQNWDDISWIKSQTTLPIILKGLMDSTAVEAARNAGASGIIVSNHGGRVLDGLSSTIDSLEQIASEGDRFGVEVYLDGGIRRGADVFKAIALGAKMVFAGRAIAYGLSHSGQEGTESVLKILNKQFINTAQLCGAKDMSQIVRGMVQP